MQETQTWVLIIVPIIILIIIFILLLAAAAVLLAPFAVQLAERRIIAIHARNRQIKKGLTRAIRKKIFKRAKKIRKIHLERLKKETRAKRAEKHKGPGST